MLVCCLAGMESVEGRDVRVVVDVEFEEVEEGVGYEVDCAVDVWVKASVYENLSVYCCLSALKARA